MGRLATVDFFRKVNSDTLELLSRPMGNQHRQVRLHLRSGKKERRELAGRWTVPSASRQRLQIQVV